jgi:hypothetical protein
VAGLALDLVDHRNRDRHRRAGARKSLGQRAPDMFGRVTRRSVRQNDAGDEAVHAVDDLVLADVWKPAEGGAEDERADGDLAALRRGEVEDVVAGGRGTPRGRRDGAAGRSPRGRIAPSAAAS